MKQPVIFGFLKNESGAVVVDWVVMTAAVVGLGVAVLGQVAVGLKDASCKVGDGINEIQVGGPVQPAVGNPSSSDGSNSAQLPQDGC